MTSPVPADSPGSDELRKAVAAIIGNTATLGATGRIVDLIRSREADLERRVLTEAAEELEAWALPEDPAVGALADWLRDRAAAVVPEGEGATEPPWPHDPDTCKCQCAACVSGAHRRCKYEPRPDETTSTGPLPRVPAAEQEQTNG